MGMRRIWMRKERWKMQIQMRKEWMGQRGRMILLIVYVGNRVMGK